MHKYLYIEIYIYVLIKKVYFICVCITQDLVKKIIKTATQINIIIIKHQRLKEKVSDRLDIESIERDEKYVRIQFSNHLL